VLKLRPRPNAGNARSGDATSGSTAADPARTGQPDPVEVASARKKFLRRQRARRWLVWRRILAVLAAIALVAGLVWLVFISSVLTVKGAEVRGVEVLTASEVEEVAAVPLGVPLATLDLTAIEARVEGLAAVRSVKASRAWPDQVRIEVVEREAVAVVSWEGQWRGLDATGVLFRSYPERPEGLTPVTMSAATPVEALAEAAAVVEALPADILQRVDHLEVTSIDGISLELRDGSRVMWGSADESANKGKVLQVLLGRKARVYDVTAPGRPTIRN
jgi:cell division protein FtsQ